MAGHGGVDDDRHARLPDLLQHLRSLGHPVQDQPEAELGTEVERRQDVLRPVCGDHQGNLPPQDPLPLLQGQVGPGLRPVPIGGCPGPDQEGPEHRHSPGPGPRPAAAAPHGLGPQGCSIGRGARQEHLRHRGPGGLHHHGLPADEGSRAVPGVEGGGPPVPDPLHQGLPRVVRIDGPELRLQGRGGLQLLLSHRSTQDPGHPHDGPGIHQAGGHHPGLHHPVPCRDADRGGGPHPLDAAVGPNQDDPVGDGGSGHGVHGAAPHGQLGRRLGHRDRRQQEQCGQRPPHPLPGAPPRQARAADLRSPPHRRFQLSRVITPWSRSPQYSAPRAAPTPPTAKR